MINYQDYEDIFSELNISEGEGMAILDYLTKIIDIAIESYNEYQYGKELFYLDKSVH